MAKKKQVNYRPKKRRGTTIVPLITLTVLVVIISAALAGVWQLLDKTEYVTPEMVASQTAPRVSSEVPPPPPPSSEAQLPESEPEPPASTDIADYQVPKGKWVGVEYFDDALFVGDSLTDGIKGYDVMSNAKVLAYTGINLDNIFTKEAIKSGDSKITIMEAAAAESPSKIYVMMGANSMGYGKEDFIKAYGRLVDELQKLHPDATVFVQSILPVTAEYAKNRPEYSNETIDEYNLALRQMARDRGMPYVNVAEALKNDNNALPTEASPKDGMHFGKSYYQKWFDYLREHTLEKE